MDYLLSRLFISLSICVIRLILGIKVIKQQMATVIREFCPFLIARKINRVHAKSITIPRPSIIPFRFFFISNNSSKVISDNFLLFATIISFKRLKIDYTSPKGSMCPDIDCNLPFHRFFQLGHIIG